MTLRPGRAPSPWIPSRRVSSVSNGILGRGRSSQSDSLRGCARGPGKSTIFRQILERALETSIVSGTLACGTRGSSGGGAEAQIQGRTPSSSLTCQLTVDFARDVDSWRLLLCNVGGPAFTDSLSPLGTPKLASVPRRHSHPARPDILLRGGKPDRHGLPWYQFAAPCKTQLRGCPRVASPRKTFPAGASPRARPKFPSGPTWALRGLGGRGGVRRGTRLGHTCACAKAPRRVSAARKAGCPRPRRHGRLQEVTLAGGGWRKFSGRRGSYAGNCCARLPNLEAAAARRRGRPIPCPALLAHASSYHEVLRPRATETRDGHIVRRPLSTVIPRAGRHCSCHLSHAVASAPSRGIAVVPKLPDGSHAA